MLIYLRQDVHGKTVRHFDEACLGLLREILSTAGLLTSGSTTEGEPRALRPVSVLDLGFGCGDQTLALARLLQPLSSQDFRYVGLTLNESQLQTAVVALHRQLSSANNDTTISQDSFSLFRANAAKPDSWSPAIRSAVQTLADNHFEERWLLALDCLYHFSPSRKPIFEYTAQKLNANVMAFDLILDEKATWRNRLLVRVVSVMMSCPFYTFLTEEQYKDHLVRCGYDREQIVLRDISDNVFGGVTDYLERQEQALSQYGISIGGFKLAGRLFGWFDRSRIVKATIVVARKKKVSPSSDNGDVE